jgi:hypothetical protein
MSFKILLVIALFAPLLLIAAGAIVHGPHQSRDEIRSYRRKPGVVRRRLPSIVPRGAARARSDPRQDRQDCG